MKIPKAVGIDTGKALSVLRKLIGQFSFRSASSSNNEPKLRIKTRNK